jgi:hypothetical protein
MGGCQPRPRKGPQQCLCIPWAGKPHCMAFSPAQNQSRGKTETHWGILGKKRKVRDPLTRTKNKFATWHRQLLRAVEAITQAQLKQLLMVAV